MTLACADCGSEMVPKQSRYGRYFGCARYPACHGVHSAHQRTGEPMGVPADRVTRGARKFAHMLFDQLWKRGEMRRPDAYAWLAGAVGVTPERAHISMLTKEECDKLIAACKARGLAVPPSGGDP